jgi:hypothetical protein
MTGSSKRFGGRGRWTAAAAGLLLLSAPVVLAEEPAPPPATTGQAARSGQPGLFETIGRWFDEGTSTFRAHLRGAKQRFDSMGEDAAKTNRELSSKAADVGRGAVEVTKDAVKVTKDAVDAVVRLPTTRVVRGNERRGGRRGALPQEWVLRRHEHGLHVGGGVPLGGAPFRPGIPGAMPDGDVHQPRDVPVAAAD